MKATKQNMTVTRVKQKYEFIKVITKKINILKLEIMNLSVFVNLNISKQY